MLSKHTAKYALLMASALFLAKAWAVEVPEQNSNGSTKAQAPQSIAPETSRAGEEHPIARSAELSGKDVFEIGLKEIEFEAKRLDRLIANAEIVGGIIVTAIIALGAILSFLGVKSIRDIKAEIRESVKANVDLAIQRQADTKETFESLVASLQSAEDRWRGIRENLDELERFTALTGAEQDDAHGAYRAARDISEREAVDEDGRKTALKLLQTLIALGETGTVDPNILFNASSVASRMEFDYEALKLITLCCHFDPKPSHIARKSRHEDVFGIRMAHRDGKLVQDSSDAEEARNHAWVSLKEQVLANPRVQCELVFSEFHNVAVRNRESGYFDDAINSLNAVASEGEMTSYGYSILAGFHLMRGADGWKADFKKAIETAIALHQSESPQSTWYEHSARDIAKALAQVTIHDEALGQQDAAQDGGSGTAPSPPVS